MMIVFIKTVWKDMFEDLRFIGKVLFFPFFIVFSIVALPAVLFEFAIIDLFVFLYLALSKEDSPKDFIDLMRD